MGKELSYKYCKQLKDAGFPQEIKRLGRFYKNGKLDIYAGLQIDTTNGDYVKVPTLSELIDYLGGKFVRLIRLSKNECQVVSSEIDTGHYIVIGKTPEEAVTKLILKLNK